MRSHSAKKYLILLLAAAAMITTACIFTEPAPTAVPAPTTVPVQAPVVTDAPVATTVPAPVRAMDSASVNPYSDVAEFIRSLSEDEQDCFARLMGEKTVMQALDGKGPVPELPPIEDLTEGQSKIMGECLGSETLVRIAVGQFSSEVYPQLGIDIGPRTLVCIVDDLAKRSKPEEFPWEEDGAKSLARCISDDELAQIYIAGWTTDMGIKLSSKTTACMFDRIVAADLPDILRQLIGVDSENEIGQEVEPELDMEDSVAVALGLAPSIFCLNANERTMLERSDEISETTLYSAVDELECFFDELGPFGLSKLATALTDGEEFPAAAFVALSKCEVPIDVLGELLPFDLPDGGSERPIWQEPRDPARPPVKQVTPRANRFEDAVREIEPCLSEQLSPDEMRRLMRGAGSGELLPIDHFIAMYECGDEAAAPGLWPALMAPWRMPFDAEQFGCLIGELGAERIQAVLSGGADVGPAEIAAVFACGINGDELLSAFQDPKGLEKQPPGRGANPPSPPKQPPKPRADRDEGSRQWVQEALLTNAPCILQQLSALEMPRLIEVVGSGKTPSIDHILVIFACVSDDITNQLLELWGLALDTGQFSCLVEELGDVRMGRLLRHNVLPGPEAVDAVITCGVAEPGVTQEDLIPVFTGRDGPLPLLPAVQQIRGRRDGPLPPQGRQPVQPGQSKPPISLIEAIDQQNIGVVIQHMQFGTNPNEQFIPKPFPFAGASALHLAVLKEKPGDQYHDGDALAHHMVDILLEWGADIDIKARETFQGTPLDWAVYWGLQEMVVHLVEMGANVNSKTTLATTPLDTAYTDNPFIDPATAEEFKANRAFIQEYLPQVGGQSGH